jgi:hypothetical protein
VAAGAADRADRAGVIPPPAGDVWAHRALEVGPSGIAGRGLFAGASIAAGTVVLRLGGRLVSSGELADLIAAAGDDPDAYVDTITVAEDRHLVLPLLTVAHWCNHGCDPDLWHVGPYDVATRRPVRAGDELTLDYATISGADGFRMACACGSVRCRGVVTSDDWRLAELRERYRGHWTPALQARIGGA